MRIDFTALRRMAMNNPALVEKLFDLEEEQIKDELFDSNHEWYTREILNDSDFIRERTLLAASHYDTKHLVDIVKFYGYEKVNTVLLDMLDSKFNETMEGETNE